jgi:hypothetical protein
MKIGKASEVYPQQMQVGYFLILPGGCLPMQGNLPAYVTAPNRITRSECVQAVGDRCWKYERENRAGRPYPHAW